MDRRQFLKSVYKTAGIAGLCGIGLSLNEAKCFADTNPYVTGALSTPGGSSFDYFDETFETIGGDETWTENSGEATFNSTTSPISGTYSCQLLDAGVSTKDITAPTASTVTEGYFSFAFQPAPVTTTTDTTRFFTLLDGSDNVIAEFRLFSTMTQIYTYYWHDGSLVLGTAESWTTSDASIVYIGAYYKAGATDAEYKFWFSTTPLGSSWGAANQTFSSKISTAGITKIKMFRDSSSNVYKYDNITGASTQVAR